MLQKTIQMSRVFSCKRFSFFTVTIRSARRNVSSTSLRYQKSNYGMTSGKAGGDEKWAQVAMEYIYEMNCTADPGKRRLDVDLERRLSTSFDRFLKVNERAMEKRMDRLAQRMSESLELLRELGMEETLEDAAMLNAEQPPHNFRRPSLTPPLPGYEPGFGMDVPQLKTQQMEYPPIKRLTDDIEFSGSPTSSFPFVEQHEIDSLTQNTLSKIQEECGELREKAPITGVEGEAWESKVALERKALARQKLILDLTGDPSFRKQYNNDNAFRLQEWKKRGIERLDIDKERDCHEDVHFAHEPTYQPFRETPLK